MNDTIVLKLSAGGTAPEVLRVERQRPLDPQQQIADADERGGENHQRAGIALPGLLVLGTRPEEPVERPLGPRQVVHAAFEDGGHVRAQVSPGDAKGDDEDDDGPGEAHLEPLRLEHGYAQVEEHDDGKGEEDALDVGHT